MIDLKNVTKIYNSKKGSSTTALNDINLTIGNSGMLFIVGKSGSGKSTLLNLLGGLDNLTSGELLINGKNISKFSKKQYDSYRNTYIGFVFQEFNILEQYNVYENIELALKLQNQKPSKEQIDELLNKLGINDLGNRKINELSGGQKQRVAIARALIKKPQIILADEPTGNLDQSSSEQIFNILKEISENQLVIVVSHDMESAKKYADRIIEIEDGKVKSDSNTVSTVEESKFELKKSKLPFSYALKMALNSFKTKPLKLFMTILLTAISLIFMGFTVNCALFDRTMLVVNTMKDNDNYVYNVGNSEFGAMGSVINFELKENDIKEIEKITKAKSNLIYSLYDDGNDLGFEFGVNDKKTQYYSYELSAVNFVEIEDSRILGNIIGKEPSNSNEIVVHKYFADYAIKFGIMTSLNELYFPKDYNDLINYRQELKLGKNKVIITGIIDDDDSLFIKARETGNFEVSKLEDYFWNTYVGKGSTVYVKGFTEKAILTVNKKSLLTKTILRDSNTPENQHYVSENMDALNSELSIITETGSKTVSSLSKNEIILSIDALKTFDSTFDSKFNKYLELNNNKTYDESLRSFISIYLKENPKITNINLAFHTIDKLDMAYISVKAIGVSLDKTNYISNQYIEEYEPKIKRINSVKIFDDNTNNLYKSLSKLVFTEFFDINELKPGIYYNYTVDVDSSYDLANIMTSYKRLAIYILVLSLVFVIFTLLLFSNFISISISYCKKEIGILRALGATSKDIIKIFGYESFIIGILSWLLSIIGWFVVCDLLNKSMFGNMYYTVNGIVTHPLVPLIMLIYTITIALMITVLSISRITNIKPIDAINNK